MSCQEQAGGYVNKILSRVFAAGFCLCTAVLLAWQPVRDTDSWYHLAAGRWILENGRIPSTDFWSFTASGEHWITHEWLYEFTLYVLYSIAGLPALVVFKTLVVALTLWIVNNTARALRVRVWIRYPIVLAAAVLAAERFTDRPHLLTFLFAATSIFILESTFRHDLGQRDEKPFRRVWWLVPLAWVWSNCHAGVIYIFAILAAYVLDYAFQLLKSRARMADVLLLRNSGLRRLLGVALSVVVATAANPNHIWTVLYPFIVTGKLGAAEFVTLELLSEHVGRFAWRRCLIIVLVLISLAQARRRPSRETILVLAFGFYGIRWLREQAFFFVAVTPFYAEMADRFLGVLFKRVKSRRQRLVLSAAGWVLLCVLAARYLPSALAARQWDVSHEDPMMPSKAIEFHRQNCLPGKVFNPHAWGGYILWKASRDIKVFVDARLDVFPVQVLSDYLEIQANRPSRQEVLKKYGVRCCLVDYSERYPSIQAPSDRGSIHGALFRDPGWALVYWGDDGMIYLERKTYEQSYSDLREWRVVDPDSRKFDGYAYEDCSGAAIDELRIHTRLHPDCRRSNRFLGHLLLRAGRYRQGADIFKRVVRMPGPAAEDFHALAFTLDKMGYTSEAIDAALEGLGFRSEYVPLLDYVGELYVRVGSYRKAAAFLRKARRSTPVSHDREMLLSVIYRELGEVSRADYHLRLARAAGKEKEPKGF